MLGHAIFWAVSTVVCGFCLVRGWRAGVEGLDDLGVSKDPSQTARVKLWVAFGVTPAFAAMLDMYLLFNPPPPLR